MSELPILSPSQRVQRVAHRLGVVIAAPLVAAALWNAGAAGLAWLNAPNAADVAGPWGNDPLVESSSTNKSGAITFDDLIPEGQSSKPEVTAAAARQELWRRHESRLNASLELAGITTAAALAIYLTMRAIGWVIAGAFRT